MWALIQGHPALAAAMGFELGLLVPQARLSFLTASRFCPSQDGKIVDDVWVVRPLLGRMMYH